MSWTDADVAGPGESWTDADVVPAKKPTSLFKRALHGLADPVIGAAQIADMAINPVRQMISPGAASMADVTRARDADYVAPEGVDWARMGGNVANPLSWASGGAGVGRAALTGASQAVLAPTSADAAASPLAFAAEKAKQAGVGAATGGAVGAVARGFRPTREAQSLMDQGIQPSFGQSMGGAVNRIEEKAASLPGVGDAIAWARRRPMAEFDARVVERATGGAARTLDAANRHASDLFDNVVPHLRPTREVVQNVQAAGRAAVRDPRLTDANRTTFTGLLDDYFGRFGQMNGAAIKDLDSQIGADIRRYAAGDPDHRALSRALVTVQQGFREGLEAGVPPELRGGLRAANTTWRNLIPLNRAASSRADEVMTPRALQKAMARQRGVDVTRMPPDALLDNAAAVLPNTVPNSGTADRVLLNALAMGASAPFGGVLPLAAATGAAFGGASRTGQAAMVGNTGLQRAMRPYTGNLSAAMAAALRGELN